MPVKVLKMIWSKIGSSSKPKERFYKSRTFGNILTPELLSSEEYIYISNSVEVNVPASNFKGSEVRVRVRVYDRMNKLIEGRSKLTESGESSCFVSLSFSMPIKRGSKLVMDITDGVVFSEENVYQLKTRR